MKAIVVYESLWGNTAAIARAIAEGIGPEARALSTAEATEAEIAGADLIVAGAPVHAFSLPSEQSRKNAGGGNGKTPAPDLSHPAMRSWLAGLAPGKGLSAAFETAFKWSPSGATSRIGQALQRAGYRPVSKAHRFLIAGGSGPLRDGEVENAKAWGAELARAMG